MLRYQVVGITGQPVEISVASDSPHRAAAIDYKGDAESISRIQPDIEESYGVFGHRVGNTTTPIDLDAALRQLLSKRRLYRVELLEGAELVESYSPGNIPKNAKT